MLLKLLTHSVACFGLSILTVDWLNASCTGHQQSFRFKDIAITHGNATVQKTRFKNKMLCR